MWIFSTSGFFSITKANSDYISKEQVDKGLLNIRARNREDLENLKKEVPILSGKKIHEYPNADYRFRIFIWLVELKELFEYFANKIDYDNFKNEVKETKGQKDKCSYYASVWSVMNRYQYKDDPEPTHGQMGMFDRFDLIVSEEGYKELRRVYTDDEIYDLFPEYRDWIDEGESRMDGFEEFEEVNNAVLDEFSEEADIPKSREVRYSPKQERLLYGEPG